MVRRVPAGHAKGPPPGGAPPGMVQVQVTADERAAIERLMAMTGQSQEEVLQAYLACDKDENLAANMLFDMPETNASSIIAVRNRRSLSSATSLARLFQLLE